MKPSVYIETTIVSYLTCWPSRNVIRLSHEMLTREWWLLAPAQFDLYTSELVHQEASAGDPAAAAERIRAISGIRLLEITPETVELAADLATALALPERARADSVHVAVSAVAGMSFLATWNCRHLANASFADKIEKACRARGYEPPRICTPEQLEIP